MHIKNLKTNHHDDYYINGILTDNSKVVQEIYDEFAPKISRYITQRGVSLEDAKDIIQDGLTIIMNKIHTNTLTLTSSFQTYFFGICKILALKRNKSPSTTYKSYMSPVSQSIEDVYIEGERKQLFSDALNQLTPKQRQIIEHYSDGKTMSEIAQLMGHKSPSYARLAKLRSRKKLEEYIKKDNRYRELY